MGGRNREIRTKKPIIDNESAQSKDGKKPRKWKTYVGCHRSCRHRRRRGRRRHHRCLRDCQSLLCSHQSRHRLVMVDPSCLLLLLLLAVAVVGHSFAVVGAVDSWERRHLCRNSAAELRHWNCPTEGVGHLHRRRHYYSCIRNLLMKNGKKFHAIEIFCYGH